MADEVQSVEMHFHATFQWNWSNDCADITLFRFFKMAAGRHLGFVGRVSGPPTKHIWCAKFGWNPCSTLHNIKVWIFCTFGLKICIHAQKITLLWIEPLKWRDSTSLRGKTSYDAYVVKIHPQWGLILHLKSPFPPGTRGPPSNTSIHQLTPLTTPNDSLIDSRTSAKLRNKPPQLVIMGRPKFTPKLRIPLRRWVDHSYLIHPWLNRLHSPFQTHADRISRFATVNFPDTQTDTQTDRQTLYW